MKTHFAFNSSLHEVSSHLWSVIINLLDLSLNTDFSGSIFSFNLYKYKTIISLLCQVKEMSLTLFINNFNIASLLFKLNINHCFSNSSSKLVCFNIDSKNNKLYHPYYKYLTLASSSSQEYLAIFLGG